MMSLTGWEYLWAPVEDGEKVGRPSTEIRDGKLREAEGPVVMIRI